METPATEMVRTKWSMGRSRQTAETTPSGTPMAMENSSAAITSSSVAGKNARISSATGRPVRIEVPRSPCARPSMYIRYCSGSGRSSPRLWRMPATMASDALSPASSRAGSPGIMCEIANVMMDTPKTTSSKNPRRRQRTVKKPMANPGDQKEEGVPRRNTPLLGLGHLLDVVDLLEHRVEPQPLDAPARGDVGVFLKQVDINRIVDHDFLRLLVQPAALGQGARMGRSGQQRIDPGVGVEGAVAGGPLLVALEPVVHEHVGVGKVGAPVADGDIEVALADTFAKAGIGHVFQAHLDADIGQIGLRGQRDRAPRRVFVRQQKAQPDIAQPGFGQQFPGLGRRKGCGRSLRIVPPHAFGNGPVHGLRLA